MKIQVYGSGCDKCKKLTANVETAAKNLRMKIELEKVTDITAITDAGILMTPALAIDGKIVSCGKVLSPEEIEKLLNDKPCSCGGTCQNAAPEEPKAEETPCCCCGGAKKTGKKYLTAVLLLFVFASLAFMFLRETREKTETTAVENQPASVVPAQKDVLTIFYFHGNMRCATCNQFEKLTQEVVQNQFADQVAAGKLVLKIINIDEPGNAHFVQDFQLTTKSVVLQKNGQYKNIDRIWSLIRQSDDDFKIYVQNEIAGMLEAK